MRAYKRAQNIATNLTVTPAIFDTKIKPDQTLIIQYEDLVWFDLGTRLGTRSGRVKGPLSYVTWSSPQAHSAGTKNEPDIFLVPDPKITGFMSVHILLLKAPRRTNNPCRPLLQRADVCCSVLQCVAVC